MLPLARQNCFLRSLCLAVVVLGSAVRLPAAKSLDVYSIDVEGGQATLFVAPSGESMLVDTGWGGFNNRDADRIAAVAKTAGVKKIDYLVITHYHADHVGGVAQLAAKLPIRNFVDHGNTVETSRQSEELYKQYAAYREKANHIEVKPGDTVPVKGLEVTVLSAGNNLISKPLAGAGAANSACAGTQLRSEDKSENARSVGTLIRYGKFSMIDLGDLTWNKEFELMCPNNRVGNVDVYLTTHHGMNMSGPAAIVYALHPRVAIMNNGARKGGTSEALKVIRSSPGIEDVWQLHYAIAAGKELNSADTFIANTDEQCEGKWIKLSAQDNGTFTVINGRNKFSKTYTR